MGSDDIMVAFSGGVDSTVLLYTLADLRETRPQLDLRALHVNHQLQASAEAWEAHCRKICASLEIPLIVEKVLVDQTQASLEAEARKARHACFQRQLSKGTYLALAHHAEDQAETLLFRLFRGTGVKGLAGMAELRPCGEGFLWRPFLERSKRDILAEAERRGLSFIEDPSNQDLHYARNYLRHEVLPKIQARWPQASQVLARSAKLFAMEADLLAEIAAGDLAGVRISETSLSIVDLEALSQIRVWHVLRTWLTEFLGQAPGVEVVMRIEKEVMQASMDAHPCLVLGNYELTRKKGVLHISHRGATKHASIK